MFCHRLNSSLPTSGGSIDSLQRNLLLKALPCFVLTIRKQTNHKPVIRHVAGARA